MVAPIDATAALEADGETLTLRMNFRTIALAEDLRADAVAGFGVRAPTASGMAALVWAFAQPDQPRLTQDEAMALVFRHGEAVGGALRELFGKAAAKPEKPSTEGNVPPAPPRKPRTK